MLKTQINDDGQGINTLALSGSLDTKSTSQLESEGISIISKGCKALIFDFSGLEFISSSGLRAIYIIAKKVMSLGGKLVSCGASGVVKDALTMSGFDSFILLKNIHAEAVMACSLPENTGK